MIQEMVKNIYAWPRRPMGDGAHHGYNMGHDHIFMPVIEILQMEIHVSPFPIWGSQTNTTKKPFYSADFLDGTCDFGPQKYFPRVHLS
jgi:hypothetical protein